MAQPDALPEAEPRFSLGIYKPVACPVCGWLNHHVGRVDAEWVGEPKGPVRTTVRYACGWFVDWQAWEWRHDPGRGCGEKWERVIVE